jgi:hypothetical protein
MDKKTRDTTRNAPPDEESKKGATLTSKIVMADAGRLRDL